MDTTRSRRMGALIASAALLASLTVATVAAPASAGKCALYENGTAIPPLSGCYYATEAITGSITVPVGVTLNGTNADDTVGNVNGTFNGDGGDDTVESIGASGTFNGGTGNDSQVGSNVYGTFNGGPGDDTVEGYVGTFGGPGGTFNGGPGDDSVQTMVEGTFAGGSGADVVYELCRDSTTAPVVWSADILYTNDCGG